MNAILEQINSAGLKFVEFALPMFVQSVVLIVILLLADFALRKKVRAVFRYWIWLLVLVKLILPTSLSSPMSLGYFFGDRLTYVDTTETPAEPQANSVRSAPANVPPFIDLTDIEADKFTPTAQPIIPVAEPAVTSPADTPAIPVIPLSWQGAVFLAWLTVVMAMILLLLQRAIFVRGLVAQAKEANGVMADTLESCRSSMPVKTKLGLKISANATSPAVCGLFSPVILVPQNLASSLTADQLRAVLLHELAHIRRGDLFVNLAQTILQIIYFYNPLLWLANCIIRRIREQSVDEMVLVAMGEKAPQYPQTLVSVAKLAFNRPVLSLRLIGVVESKSALSARIKHILNRPMPKKAKLGIISLLTIIAIAAVLLPMAKGNADDLTFITEGYRFKRTISQSEMLVMMSKISHLFDSLTSDLLRDITGRNRSKTHEIIGYSTTGEIAFTGTRKQHARVKKFLRKEYADLLRPPKLYDMDDVADIDTFANTLSTIVKDVFIKLKFRFLTEENVDYIAKDIGDFVRTYTRSDVSKETQLQVLEALDAYLYQTFRSTSTYERQRVYLNLDDRIKTLKLKLWQVIAAEPLTFAERAALKKQKQWIYDFLEERFPQATQLEKAAGMYGIDRVFNDVLNGFSRQPMSAETFRVLQSEISNEDSIARFATNVSCWSAEIAMEYLLEYGKNKTEWSFPFGVVKSYMGSGYRVDFSFKSEKPALMDMVWFHRSRGQINRCVYDVASKRPFYLPDDCSTTAILQQWLKEQDKGDVYYEPEGKSIIACRGAKMAVLDVNNWIDTDQIPTEQLRNIIQEKSISQFSLSGFRSLNNFPLRNKDKPVVPIIAVETKRGNVALICPYNTSDRRLYVRIRHRFDGWRDLWFASFITGQLKKPTKISKTTHSLKSKTNDLTLTATLPNGVTVEHGKTDTIDWVIEDYGQTRLLSKEEIPDTDNWVSVWASAVKNKGRYLVPDRGLTLKDLIKAAGYNRDKLAESYVELIRRSQQGNISTRSTYSRNLKTLLNGEESDIVIKPHDSIGGGYIEPSANGVEFWSGYSFGEVVEMTVNDDGAEINFFADLDTGKLVTPPDTLDFDDENAILRWIKDNGIDVMGETASSVHGLIGFNMYAARVDNYFWDAGPLEFTDRLMVRIDDPVLLSVESLLPVTYLIKTSKYKMGILQILGFVENPKGIKIRYKLLNKETAPKPDIRTIPEPVSGDWQYIGQSIPPDYNDTMILAENVNLGSIGRDAEGKTFITFVRNGQEAQNRQYRFVLFNKAGDILEPDGHIVLGESERLEEKFTFDESFSTRQLKGFRFQDRPLPPTGIDNISSQLQKPSSEVFEGETLLPSDLAPPGRYAVELDGVDDYLLVPDNPSLRLEPPFTIEMWIKTKLPPDASEYRGGWALMSKGFTVGTPRAYLTGFGINLDRRPNKPSQLYIDYCKANHSGTYSATYAGYPLTNGTSEWLHITHVFEGKYYKSTPGHPLVMGKFLIPTNNPFKGLLGEVRLWNGARTRQELRQYENVALTGKESGLAACWNFEQTKGKYAYDISGNNHARLGKFTDPDNADPKWIDLQAPSPQPDPKTDAQVLKPVKQPETQAADKWIPLKIDYPEPSSDASGLYYVNSVSVRGKKLAEKPHPVLVPPDVTNIAKGKPVTSTDAMLILDELEYITDGDKRSKYFVEYEPKELPQHVTIDLEREYEIYAVAWWHRFGRAAIYWDVVIQVGRDPKFEDAVILFNNDHDGSLGLGKGNDLNYVETNKGWMVGAAGVLGRYIRLYNHTNTRNSINQYTEVEVYGR